MKTIITTLLCLFSIYSMSQSTIVRHKTEPTQLVDKDQSNTIISNTIDHMITVQFNVNRKAYLFDIYDLSGNLVKRESLVEQTSTFSFLQSGTFVFEIVDLYNNQIKQQGRFTI